VLLAAAACDRSPLEGTGGRAREKKLAAGVWGQMELGYATFGGLEPAPRPPPRSATSGKRCSAVRYALTCQRCRANKVSEGLTGGLALPLWGPLWGG
jgi:hypothetical protein